jgi:2-dehydro-3-deoxyphosphogluconate aldolase/(4S)-4-hydroxy-2-oxoglutarate aldolase
MQFTNTDIVAKIKELGLVPLFTHDDVAISKKVIEAAYRGGVRVFEFTNRRKNSFEVFVAMLDYCKKFPDLMLGIGTVMDAATTQRFIDAGAHFIISPILKLEMAEVCNRNNILWMPGCATLTEIVTARDHGAEVIKVFPGSVLGPGFVFSIMPVVPGLKLMITGGVEPNEKNLTAWFKAGAMSVGMGSQLFTKDILDNQDWKGLEESVRSILQIIKDIRK